MCMKSDVYSEQVIFHFPIMCWNLVLRTVFAYCDCNPKLLSFLQLQNPELHTGLWMELLSQAELAPLGVSHCIFQHKESSEKGKWQAKF